MQPCGAEEVAVLKKKQSRRNPVVCHGSRGSATSKESVNVTTDHQVRAETLYQKHGKALVAFAASIVGPADAEDVVASVAAKVLFSADLDRANNPQAYLYRAVQNGARSHLRSNGRRSRREQRTAFDRALAPGTDAGGPDLASALDALSPRQRSVVHLTYWEELTGAEVAERLGMSEGSVRKHLARAKETMKGLIND